MNDNFKREDTDVLTPEQYEKRISELSELNDQYKARLQETTALLRETKAKLKEVTGSRGYSFVKKYYRLRERLLPPGSRRVKVIRTLLLPILIPMKKIKAKRAERMIDGTEYLTKEQGLAKLRDCKRVDILTVGHTEYIAVILKEMLVSHGIECNILYEQPELYEDIPYIIICPQIFTKFPPLYIAFQMEQTIDPRWMTEQYFKILRNAYAVFDYSLVNLEYFSKDPEIKNKLYYLPVDVSPVPVYSPDPGTEKEYDVLFYGASHIERRRMILDRLSKKFNVKVESNLFGEPLYREMSKARIVINIHYYENAMLETTRLHETLSVGTSLIVSERSCDADAEARLSGIVDFVPEGDVAALEERISYWLSHEDERVKRVEQNNELLKSRTNQMKFYFNRFLLANDRLSFDDFYNESGDFVTVDTDRLCLSLPETVERRKAFDDDNKYGFAVMPGLKHNIGWVGCGLSYKFLAKRALDCGYKKLLICEDDTFFPPDFDERFKKILRYTAENSDWDAFSGIMADIGNVKVLSLKEQDGETYVYLNRIVSTVFNMYSEKTLALMSAWDPFDRDVYKNTIDRYLEGNRLSILTTCPFLAGHKEDLDSTIWGKSNTAYDAMMQSSNKKLKKLAQDAKNQFGR